MVKFEEVSPEDIDNMRRGRRGRVSYPILKGFLETGFYLAKLDRHGIQQSKQSLSSSLNAYIRSHNMPIKMFQRQGDMFLMRLDIDEHGEPIANWEEYRDGEAPATAIAISPDEVQKRFDEEKGQTTK